MEGNDGEGDKSKKTEGAWKDKERASTHDGAFAPWVRVSDVLRRAYPLACSV